MLARVHSTVSANCNLFWGREPARTVTRISILLAHAVLTRLHIANAECVPGSGDVCCAALLPSKNETVLPGADREPAEQIESQLSQSVVSPEGVCFFIKRQRIRTRPRSDRFEFTCLSRYGGDLERALLLVPLCVS